MDFYGAITAGIVATSVFSVVLAIAPRMGMPKMDIVGLLDTMFGSPVTGTLGWSFHFLSGVIFAFIYAGLWGAGIGSPDTGGGALFGAIHWLMIGALMGMMPVMHAGIQSGEVDPPGFYMSREGRVMGFVGGLIGHVVYGVAVAWVYGLF